VSTGTFQARLADTFSFKKHGIRHSHLGRIFGHSDESNVSTDNKNLHFMVQAAVVVGEGVRQYSEQDQRRRTAFLVVTTFDQARKSVKDRIKCYSIVLCAVSTIDTTWYSTPLATN
jgi:hypothetical protein